METAPRTTESQHLVCLQCEATAFEAAEGDVSQEFRNETFAVRTPVMRCTNCGWQTLGPGQLDDLRIRTADAYRRKHTLLTSEEIRGRRGRLGMSQRDFARHIGVGPASIPRWESWQVQERIYDDKIRQETDSKAGVFGAVATTWVTTLDVTGVSFPTNQSDLWSIQVPITDLFTVPAFELKGFEAVEKEVRERMRISQWVTPTAEMRVAKSCDPPAGATKPRNAKSCGPPRDDIKSPQNAQKFIDAAFSITA
jgi:putative zinc finger/helix-turn-helix YgiT family protein